MWSPTQQEYLNLFSNYISQRKNHYKRFTDLVDLGSGTGILPIIMSQNGGFPEEGQIYSFDSYSRAVECTKMNSQIFNLASRQKAVEVDLVDLYYSNSEENTTAGAPQEMAFYKKVSSDLGFPMTVDLITCNPPWIPSAFVKETSPLDNGVYDPDEKFLKSALNFARIHLNRATGEMLLIYSDMGYQLGL